MKTKIVTSMGTVELRAEADYYKCFYFGQYIGKVKEFSEDYNYVYGDFRGHAPSAYDACQSLLLVRRNLSHKLETILPDLIRMSFEHMIKDFFHFFLLACNPTFLSYLIKDYPKKELKVEILKAKLEYIIVSQNFTDKDLEFECLACLDNIHFEDVLMIIKNQELKDE